MAEDNSSDESRSIQPPESERRRTLVHIFEVDGDPNIKLEVGCHPARALEVLNAACENVRYQLTKLRMQEEAHIEQLKQALRRH